jgi:hypothetical protein
LEDSHPSTNFLLVLKEKWNAKLSRTIDSEQKNKLSKIDTKYLWA